jgi:DNA-binding transcriptional ArsR family regulator
MTQISKGCCSGLGDVLTPDLFKALCDRTRLSILIRLAECCGEMTVSEVASCCPINISVVSRHLATLRDAGILEAVRRGKEVHYSVRAAALAKTLRDIADAVERCCPPRQKEQT